MTQPPKRKRAPRKRAQAEEILPPERQSTELVPLTGEAAHVWRSIETSLAQGKTPDEMTKLYDLFERMLDRSARAAFDAAFIRMAPNLPRIKRTGELLYPVDRSKPQGEKYKVTNYAKYEDIDAGIRPILSEFGFRLNFRIEPRPDGGGLIITAILSGHNHSEEATIPIPLDKSGGKNDIQAYGSSLSYGKKYSAFAVLNIVTEGEDDDGTRGGMRFISPEDIAELRALCTEVNRSEEAILRRMFSDSVHSFDELEQGTPHLAVKNMLLGIRQQQQRPGDD